MGVDSKHLWDIIRRHADATAPAVPAMRKMEDITRPDDDPLIEMGGDDNDDIEMPPEDVSRRGAGYSGPDPRIDPEGQTFPSTATVRDAEDFAGAYNAPAMGRPRVPPEQLFSAVSPRATLGQATGQGPGASGPITDPNAVPAMPDASNSPVTQTGQVPMGDPNVAPPVTSPLEVSAPDPQAVTPAPQGAPPPQTPVSPSDAIRARSDELVNSYTAQAASPAPGTAPTEDDVAYQQSLMLDAGYKDSLKGLALEQATAEAQARARVPFQQAFDDNDARLVAKRSALIDQYTQMHRQFWDQAMQAQQQADAAYPNPDDLLGGKGSWARAIALGIASSAAGMGPGGAAELVSQEAQSQMAGREAEYGRLRQRATDAAGNAEEAFRSMGVEDASIQGLQNAARSRLADQFALIASKTQDVALQAKYLALSGELKERTAKAMGAFATQLSNRDLKQMQLEEKNWKYVKGVGWTHPGMTGGGGGSGPGGSGPGMSSALAPTPAGMKHPVRMPDYNGQPGGYFDALDPKAQEEGLKMALDFATLDDSENELQKIMIERNGAMKAGGNIWKKWQDTKEQQAEQMFVEATQLWAKVIHGRSPGKFTMQEVRDEYPNLKKAWEAGDPRQVVGFLRDAQDRQLSKKMHLLGAPNVNYSGDRPKVPDAPNSATISGQVVGDYVPGHSPNWQSVIGDPNDPSDVGSIGQYVQNFYDHRKSAKDATQPADDSELIAELVKFKSRAKENQDRARKEKNRAAVSAYGNIILGLDAKIAEVKSGKAKRDVHRRVMENDIPGEHLSDTGGV